MFVWGTSSLNKIVRLHPKMQLVLKQAIQIVEIDMTIIEGVRSEEQCYINFGQGRTAAQCKAGGCPEKYAQPKKSKVTWVKRALDSNHYKKSDGFGYAVDIYPYPVSLVLGKKTGWEPLFDKIAKAMFEAVKQINETLRKEGKSEIKIRWGANWDLDAMPRERGETDNPHFELRA